VRMSILTFVIRFLFTTTFAIRISSYIKNVRLRTDGIDKHCFHRHGLTESGETLSVEIL
jgi:uncharacterized membrane protein